VAAARVTNALEGSDYVTSCGAPARWQRQSTSRPTAGAAGSVLVTAVR